MEQNKLNITKLTHQDLLQLHKLITDYLKELETQLNEIKKEVDKND